MKIYQSYQRLIGSDKYFRNSNEHVQVTGEKASELLRKKLLEDAPLMVTRFGANELNCILNFVFINTGIVGNFGNIIKGMPYFFSLKKGVVAGMNIGAGFFPADKKSIERYCLLSLDDLSAIDVLGSWVAQEQFLFDRFDPNHTRIQLEDLSPFDHVHPWSGALAGKKVLVVHPFEDTIRVQYQKRQHLFRNQEILPEFELKTIKAVQSIANSETPYKTWFEALDAMTDQIAKTDFDIALLGCGAYGMPLAARIKRMGKKAVHIGGATQCFFGIKGKRWEIPFYNYQNKYYNSYWVRPGENDTPKNAGKVEDGCYW